MMNYMVKVGHKISSNSSKIRATNVKVLKIKQNNIRTHALTTVRKLRSLLMLFSGRGRKTQCFLYEGLFFSATIRIVLYIFSNSFLHSVSNELILLFY